MRLVLNRRGADARRDRRLEDIPTKDGFHRDEYPPAVGRGKGKGLERERHPRGWKADVRYVPSRRIGRTAVARRKARTILQRHTVPVRVPVVTSDHRLTFGSNGWIPTRAVMYGFLAALAAVIALSWLVGTIGGEHAFDWELAAVFGTALGTTLLAITTGALAVLTAREVSATKELASLTRDDQLARARRS